MLLCYDIYSNLIKNNMFSEGNGEKIRENERPTVMERRGHGEGSSRRGLR